MSFMQPQITVQMDWVYFDTSQGGYFIPSEDVGEIPEDDWKSKVWAANNLDLDPKDIWEIGMQRGHGARLSAPGYLDCTDWTVHDTDAEAAEYLLEYYGDGMDEDEINWLDGLKGEKDVGKC